MKNCIFVDCFNTIILRKISADDVLYCWSKKVGEYYKFPPIFFYRQFKKAQNYVGKRAFFKYHGEVEYTFDQLMERIFLFVEKSGISKEEFKNTALNFYLDAEKENQYANEEVIKLLRQYKANGCKIYIVSNFYCGKQTIQAFLKALGIQDIFDDVFVSCDYKKSKRTGRLYRQVLKTLHVKRKNVLMLGDNRFVDCFMARLNFISAKKINSKIEKTSKKLCDLAKKDEKEQEYEKIFSLYKDKYNYSNFAFPLYLFIKRLHHAFESAGGGHLIFFAREGQFLKKLFDEYCQINNYKVDTRYMYVSRNSVLLASLKPIGQEDFAFLKKSAKTMNLKTFLATLSFTDKQIEQISNQLGVKKDFRTFDFYQSELFKNLLANKTFVEIYDSNRQKNYAAFNEYLKTFDIDFAKEGMQVVDIGWGGSIQDYINKFFDGKINMRGYYLGLLRSGQNREGMICSCLDKNILGNKLFRHRIFDYEQICRADHNRCAGYQLTDGKLEIVFGNELQSKKVFDEVIYPMQSQIFDKFVKICETDCKNSNFDYIACLYFWKMINNISREDKKWLQACEDTHFDFYVRIGFTFKAWGHAIINMMHWFQDFGFRLKFFFPMQRLKREMKKVS